MERRIEIIVRSCEMRVQRTANPDLLLIDLRIIMRVLAFVHYLAAAKYLKAGDKTVLTPGKSSTERRKSLLVKSHARRRRGRPSARRRAVYYARVGLVHGRHQKHHNDGRAKSAISDLGNIHALDSSIRYYLIAQPQSPRRSTGS